MSRNFVSSSSTHASPTSGLEGQRFYTLLRTDNTRLSGSYTCHPRIARGSGGTQTMVFEGSSLASLLLKRTFVITKYSTKGRWLLNTSQFIIKIRIWGFHTLFCKAGDCWVQVTATTGFTVIQKKRKISNSLQDKCVVVVDMTQTV